jgi:hypothetical protein
MTGPINTKTVADFRTLKFTSLDDIRREAERIAAAERAGALRRSGNWTAGQTFGHLAAWIDFAFDGYPPQIRPPWFVRALAPLAKGRFLSKPLPRGFRIPKVEGGTVATEPLTLDEGLSRLTAALDRLERSAPTHPNPVFGPLTHEQWKQAHLRHAELHLGYLHPAG